MTGHLPRDVGILDAVQSVVPEPVVVAMGVLSVLGNPFFLILLLVVAYWFGDRRRGAWLVAVGGGGLALIIVLKAAFALTRPAVPPKVPPSAVPVLVRPLYESAVDPSSYAFPSGHATGSTIVYGALAYTSNWATPRRRLAVASVPVAIAASSRVVIGVHFPADVVAGVVVGAAYLLVMAALAKHADFDRIDLAFLIAIVLGAVAVGVDPSEDSLLALGGMVGGVAAWTLLDVPRDPWPQSLGGVARGTGGMGATVVAAVPIALLDPAGALLAALMAVVIGVAVGFPALTDAVERRLWQSNRQVSGD